MLSVKQIHLLIDQGLNSLGIFTEMANLHEQVDLEMNKVVEKHIRDLKDTPAKQRTILEENIIKELTRVISFNTFSFTGRYYTSPVPDDFGELSNSYSLVGLCCTKGFQKPCTNCPSPVKEVVGLQSGHYYIADGKVKYNNKWYNDQETFLVLDGIKDVYGKYKELITSEKRNMEVTIDSLEPYSISPLIRNSLKPLFAFDTKKFYIYYQPKKKEQYLELHINYTARFTDAMKISWCDNKTLQFSSEIQNYYIDLTIARLATINKQEQQNINNLKSETV